MTTIACNPPGIEASRLVEPLSLCFGGRWNARLVRWYLTRSFRGFPPDLMLVLRDGVPIAGNAINYRQLRRPDGTIVDVGIVTSSWTLPTERRRGHFSRLMVASADRAAERGSSLLLGFVTAGSGSELGLRDHGAGSVPTVYLSAGPETWARGDLPIEPVDLDERTIRDLFAPDDAAVAFHYARTDDWIEQFLRRPYPTEVLRIGESCFAIMELAPETDRLQIIGGECSDRLAAASALAERAGARGRQFFMFSTAGWASGDLDSSPFRVRAGFIMCLPTRRFEGDACSITSLPWAVQSGDRM